jgi:hypothetical protein
MVSNPVSELSIHSTKHIYLACANPPAANLIAFTAYQVLDRQAKAIIGSILRVTSSEKKGDHFDSLATPLPVGASVL